MADISNTAETRETRPERVDRVDDSTLIMPDPDIELGPPADTKKKEATPEDMSEPESFYRDVRSSTDSHKLAGKETAVEEDESKKPVIPPRTHKPPSKGSTDDIDPKQLKQDHRSLKKDYNELNADLKSAWRENKEQAHELRDLKKQNAQLKEAIRASGDNRSHKDQILTERRRFYEHVDMLDDHINHLKHQLDKTKLHMDQLTFQTREANEEKAAYESKLQALQKQNARLNDDLTECRDDILRLQPPSQIPDSKIAEQCSNLYQQIASWVDDEAEESSSMETQLGNLFADKEAPELLKSCMDGDLIRATRKHSDAEPLILRYIIQCHLHRMILTDDIYLFGLDDHNVTILRSIEHAMEDLEPKRDALTIKRWRSETLQALAKIPGFRDEQTSQAVAVSKSLFSALCYLLPEISSKDDSSGWRKLHETCTMPAVQLATTMRFSTAVYRMIPRLPSRASSSPSERHILYHHDIGRYTLVDVASQKVIRQESIIKIGEDGRIGENLMVVQPLLLRMQKETGGVALCKPVVVIKLDEPLARKGRGIKVLGTWTSGWFGGEQSEGREESTRA